MKKSSILAVPLVALMLLVAFTSSTRAVSGTAPQVQGATTMRSYRVVFCGWHSHHHGHLWCSGYADYWCPGHR